MPLIDSVVADGDPVGKAPFRAWAADFDGSYDNQNLHRVRAHTALRPHPALLHLRGSPETSALASTAEITAPRRLPSCGDASAKTKT